MNFNCIKYFSTIICISFGSILLGQEIDNRKTEADIKVEDRFVQAKFLVASGKTDDAIKLLDTIRRESGKIAAVYFELAKLFNAKKDINQTESNLKEAVALEPDNTWIRLFEVSFFQDMGRYGDAITTLSHLSTLSPKNGDYYDQMVSLYIKKNELPKALQVLDNKEANIGFQTNTVLKKAEIHDNNNDIPSAVNELNRLVDRHPSSTKYLRLIASLLDANDMRSEALVYHKKVLALDPEDEESSLAVILQSTGDLSEKEYLATLTPLVNNTNVPIDAKISELLPYVQQHADTKDTLLEKQLIALCDALVLSHPNEAKAHAIYGDVLMNSEQVTAAIRQYEKTLALNKSNFMVWQQLMYGLDIQGNNDQLGKVAKECLDFFPNQAMPYYYAGKVFAANGEEKKALSSLEEAVMVSAENPNIVSRVLSVKAEMLYRKNQIPQAIQLLEQSLDLSQNKNTASLVLKGDIARDQKDMVSAIKYWTLAKELGDISDSLKMKIETSNN